MLSSDCEGFGNVLVESIIICQTPPVSTNCPGGPAEILTGPLARGLTALTDESLAKTLAELYASPPVVDRETIASFGINAILPAIHCFGRQPKIIRFHMQNSAPLLSVVVAVYNGEAFSISSLPAL